MSALSLLMPTPCSFNLSQNQEEEADEVAPAKKTTAAGAADPKGVATLRAFFAPVEGSENLASAEENAATTD